MSSPSRDTDLRLTVLQAYDAMRHYFEQHAQFGWSVEYLFLASRYDNLAPGDYPLSLDPREYDEFRDCVDQVIAKREQAEA